jgi:hypothetical protein
MPEDNITMLSGSAIAIITLIIVITVGATALQSIQNTQEDDISAFNVTDTNNPITANTSAGFRAIGISGQYAPNPLISTAQVRNATNGNLIPSTNYTISGNTIAWLDKSFNSTPYKYNLSFTVTWDILNEDYNATTAGLSSLKTYSDFFSVIVVVLVFAAIIGFFALYTLGRRNF